MDGRSSIHLTSISGKGIRSLALFQKPTLYAVISVDGSKKEKIPPDPAGGENPTWDHPVRLDLDGRPDLLLEFDLMAQGNILLLTGDRLVGKVSVPVDHLLAEGADGSACHVSYQVNAPDGKPNGILNFSYRISQPLPRQMDLPLPSPPAAEYSNYYQPSAPPEPEPDPEPKPDYYPPPAASYYPPPPVEHVPYYPPVEHVPYYPKVEHVPYYPPVEHVPYHPPAPGNTAAYPPPESDQACCYYPPGYAAAYPPTGSGPACCYYPPPGSDPACCYYPPQPPTRPPYDPYGYRQENCDRRSYY